MGGERNVARRCCFLTDAAIYAWAGTFVQDVE